MSLTFKTLDEKQKALDAINTEPPPGVNIDQFQSETEAKIDEIMTAAVDEKPAAPGNEPPPEDPPAGDEPNIDMRLSPDPPPADPKPEDPPDDNEPNLDMNIQNPPPEKGGSNLTVEQENELLKRNNDYLTQLQETNSRETDEKIKSLEKKIDDLKKAGPAATDGQPAPDSSIDKEMTDIRTEIAELEKIMNTEDDDLYDTEAQLKNVKRASQLNLKLSALQQKKMEDLITQQAGEIKELKSEQKLKRKALEDEEKDTKRDRSIEDFRKLIPALRGDKKYSEMEEEYSSFATQVASAYFNVSPKYVKAKDTEIAMQKYLAGNPILNEALIARGVQEPADMRKFVILSEIDALRQGYVLDKISGKFVQLKTPEGNRVSFPSLRSAYLHLQQENGEYGKNILKAQKNAAKNILHAMTRKADPVELTSEQQRGAAIDDMTEERADEIIRKFSTDEVVMRARKSFKDPLVTEYNKALLKKGYAPLTEDDL